MSTNGKGNEPLGYGHDHKGAALGDAKNEGRPSRDAPAGRPRRRAEDDHVHARRPGGRGAGRRDHLPHRAALRHQPAAPVLFAEARLPAGRQLPRLHGRGRGRARARGELHPQADRRHEGEDPDRPRQDRAPHGGRAPDGGPAGARRRARSGVGILEDRDAPEGRDEPLRAARRGARARPQPSRHGGQSRRLHPVQSVRPRLPRSAGQRRDRHGGPRPPREDRVRLRRPDGRVHLRRVRRVRAGLPDRRPDAVHPGERQQRAHRGAFPRPLGRQRVPLLRRRLPAHLSHQGRQAALCHRQERAGEREPPVREGPLRLRLRAQSAAPHPADDPEGRRAEGAARVHRSDEPVDALPPRHLGRGARPRARRPQAPARHPRPEVARRLRLGQVHQRGEPTCSRSWCAPASAPTMSTTARGCAMPRRSRRCSKASARRRCRRPSTR